VWGPIVPVLSGDWVDLLVFVLEKYGLSLVPTCYLLVHLFFVRLCGINGGREGGEGVDLAKSRKM